MIVRPDTFYPDAQMFFWLSNINHHQCDVVGLSWLATLARPSKHFLQQLLDKGFGSQVLLGLNELCKYNVSKRLAGGILRFQKTVCIEQKAVTRHYRKLCLRVRLMRSHSE
jgi:hypothetical protein